MLCCPLWWKVYNLWLHPTVLERTSVLHGEHLNGYSKRKIFKRILKTAAEESWTCQSFRDRWLTSADESVLGDGLFTSAAVLRLLERLHPECVGMKRLQLLRLQKAKQQQKTKEVLKCCDLTGLQWVQVLWVIRGDFYFFSQVQVFRKRENILSSSEVHKINTWLLT